jgi:hypothetical protein
MGDPQDFVSDLAIPVYSIEKVTERRDVQEKKTYEAAERTENTGERGKGKAGNTFSFLKSHLANQFAGAIRFWFKAGFCSSLR